MRKAPTLDSPITSQARFGEKIQILEQKGDWSHIQTPDKYTGWALNPSMAYRDTPYEPNIKTSRLTAHLYGIQDTEYGPLLTLPYGSSLHVLDASHPRWIQVELPDGKTCFIQKGDVDEKSPPQTKADLVEFSQKFLELPYTWGGRTSFGFDCSGFVQMLYEQIGISLLRDARLQIQDPRFKFISKSHLEPGDLIFWGKSAEKVSHVGMYIGNGKFIHAVVTENMPWIRISSLNSPEWMEGAAARPYRAFLQLNI